jgi:hypothetical protein
MTDMLAAVSGILDSLEKTGALFRSLIPFAARFRSRIDLEKLTEDFFSGDIVAGSRVHARGILFPYNCILPPVAYAPQIVGSATEQVKSSTLDPNTGHRTVTVELSTMARTLSPPVNRFNDVELVDGTRARIAWLYPEQFNGLIFDHLPSKLEGQSQGEVRGVVFTVKREQQPVLCLLPTTAQYDSLYGSCVDVIGSVSAADPQIASLVTGSLDQFRTDFLSRCIRPFEATSLCLAVDLRGTDAQASRLSFVDELRVVIGVQAIIEMPEVTTEARARIVVAAIDAVPDRAGMGPLRMIKYNSEAVHCVISNGNLRWTFDETASAIAAYREVNMADREDVTRSTAELAHHWQAWQKHARRAIESATGRSPIIRPLFVWDPGKFAMFHPGGLQLPRKLEAQLYDSNPAFRRAVDWLRVGTGRFPAT